MVNTRKNKASKRATNKFFSYGLDAASSTTPPSLPPIESAPPLASTGPSSAPITTQSTSSPDSEDEDERTSESESEGDLANPVNQAAVLDKFIASPAFPGALREAAFEEGKLLFELEPRTGESVFITTFRAAFLSSDEHTGQPTYYIDIDVCEFIAARTKQLNCGLPNARGRLNSGRPAIVALKELVVLHGIRDFFINTAQKFIVNLPEEPDFFVEPTQLRLKIFILLGYIAICACQKRDTPLKNTLAPFALDFYEARSSFIPASPNLVFFKEQAIFPNTGAAIMGNTKTTSTTEANVNGASEMNETNEAQVNGTHETNGATIEQTGTSEAPAALTKNQKKRMRQKKNKEAKDKIDEAENTTAASQGQVNGYEHHATTEAEVKNGEGVEQESNIEVTEGQLGDGDAHTTTQSEIKIGEGKEEESNTEVIEGEVDEDHAHATAESEVKKAKGKDEESDEEDCFAAFAGWLKRRDEEFEDKTGSTEDEPSGDTEGKGKETENNTGGIGDDLTGDNHHATAESEDEDDDMYGPANPVAATTRVLPTIVGSTGITASAHRPPRPRPNITRPANYPETRSPFEPVVASAHRPPRPRPDITRPTQNSLLFNETYSAHGAALAAAARGTSALTPVIHDTENTTTSTAASTPFAQPIQGTTHFDNPPRLGHGFFDPAAASFGLTGPPDPNVPGTTMLNTHGIEPVYEMATQALAMYGGRPLPGLSNFLGVPIRPRARAGPPRRPTMRHVPFMPVPLSHFDEPAAAASAKPLPTAASRPVVAAAAAPLVAPVVAPVAAAANVAPAPPSRRLPRATRAGANARQALADEIEAVWAANAHLPPAERQAAWAAARQRLLQGDTLAAARRQAGLRQTATAATQEAVRPEGHRFDIGGMGGGLGQLEEMQAAASGSGPKKNKKKK